MDWPPPIINAAGPVTRLGGHRLDPEVVDAMSRGAQGHHPIDELQAWAGDRIAAATSAEAGWVTAGASAGLLLATAACLSRMDPAIMDRLPQADGLPNEVVVQRGHRNAYDHAVRAAGARFVEVGYEGYPGAGRTHAWQVADAITDRTVAVFFAVLDAPGTLPLTEVASIAHSRGVPVIVDAAASLPPVANLRRFVQEGADLVAFSGGKAIGGPQASGILCGRADLIRSAGLQHLDMDMNAETWSGRALIPDTLMGMPHHGVGRPAKVGKETIFGLVAALDRFQRQDHSAELKRQSSALARIAEELVLPAWARTAVSQPTESRAYPTLALELGQRDRAARVSLGLQAGVPGVYLGEGLLDKGTLLVIASTLSDAEVSLVAARLNSELTRIRDED